MEFVTLKLDFFKGYSDHTSSNDKMYSLGSFFATDVGCPAAKWDDWIYDDSKGIDTSGNITLLGKYDSHIHLCFLYNNQGRMNDLEKTEDKIIISRDNLFHLIEEWEKKVCAHKPHYVTITKMHDTFTLTTNND